jgi:hypothetical protein
MRVYHDVERARAGVRTAVVAFFMLLSLLGAVPSQAHHSFAMFDRSKTITLSGTVRSFSWTNPHTFVWIFVQNDQGGEDLWAIEFSSGPVVLARSGWSRETLKPGDKITIEVNPLRDGRAGGMLKRAHLPDGRILDEEIDPSPADLKEGSEEPEKPAGN